MRAVGRLRLRRAALLLNLQPPRRDGDRLLGAAGSSVSFSSDEMIERLQRAWGVEPGYSKTAIVNAVTRAAAPARVSARGAPKACPSGDLGPLNRRSVMRCEEWRSWTTSEDLERAAGELASLGAVRPTPIEACGILDPVMDALRRDDIERARRTPPAEKALQALDLMFAGIELRRAGLRARRPEATATEIEAELRRWLVRDG